MSTSDHKRQRKPFLYQTVRDDIVGLIRSRGLKEHDPIPSEGSIAKTYRVSRMTGKLALQSLEDAGIIYRLNRRGSFLSEGFEERIQKLDVSESRATSARTQQITVALIVPVLDFFIGDIIKSIIEAAEKKEMRVVLRITDEDPDKEDRIISELVQLPYIRGIMLFPTDRKDFSGELLRLKLDRYPIVLIDRTYSNLSFDSVLHAHYQGAHDMTSYLVGKGHSSIGFVSAPTKTTRSRDERYQGYLHALMEHNAPIKKEFIQIVEENIHPEHGFHVLDSPALAPLKRYLKANGDLTAVLCSDDYVAIELYYAAIALGIRIPEDLSIAGFSDNRVLRFVPTKISTVSQPVGELGPKAIEMIVARIAHPKSDYQEIIIDTEIIDRGSILDRRKNMSGRSDV